MSATPHTIAFADATPAQQATVAALETLGVNNHALMSDGSVHVNGTLDIRNYGLSALPDLSLVHVKGSFMCGNNQLTTLKGAPCAVTKDFGCDNNRLTSLEGAPRAVGQSFYCGHNQLRTLEGGPDSVGGGYFCNDNQITVITGAPASVYAGFDCRGNPLSTLEGAPQGCQQVIADFGWFMGWSEVPENLKTSPQTRARMIEDAARAAVKTTAPVVLKGLSIGGIKRCGR